MQVERLLRVEAMLEDLHGLLPEHVAEYRLARALQLRFLEVREMRAFASLPVLSAVVGHNPLTALRTTVDFTFLRIPDVYKLPIVVIPDGA